MTVYAFDVDHTLWLSQGPVQLSHLTGLRQGGGHIVGLCGNWAVVTWHLKGWHHLFSFIGPMAMTKALFLAQIKQYVPAERYVFVGNDPAFYGESQDKAAAEEAGWQFLREVEFVEGSR